MAKADIVVQGAPLSPGGIDDTMPIAQQALSFFRAKGFVINNGVAIRMTGKRLVQIMDDPVTAIHSDRRNAVWIQTSTELIFISDFFHAFL